MTLELWKNKTVPVKRFSQMIVCRCVRLIEIVAVGNLVLCWRSGEQLDPMSVAAICTAIIGELACSALCRAIDAKKVEKETPVTQTQDEPGR